MDFRSQFCEQVTCSDASTLGGGICVSEGLTEYGVAATNCTIRGDVPEAHDLVQVLTVGLFDGIGALRVAADTLGLPIAGHVSVEVDPKGRRVVESWFPGTHFFEDIRDFETVEIKQLAVEFIGAGPPCQGVSGLNADKLGALRDARSSLFQEIPRIEEAFKKAMPWAQVHRLMESVASMSEESREIMSAGVRGQAFKFDAFGLALCHRPRLYWPTWELRSDLTHLSPSLPGTVGPKWERLLSLVYRMLSPFWKQVGRLRTIGGSPPSPLRGHGGTLDVGRPIWEIVRPMKLRGGSWTSIVSPLTSIETRQA
jgi:hypothetical protein